MGTASNDLAPNGNTKTSEDGPEDDPEGAYYEPMQRSEEELARMQEHIKRVVDKQQS